MSNTCEEIHEWIEEKIERPVEKRKKKSKKKCKKKKCRKRCLCCNKWKCWTKWIFYTVVQYVFVWVGKWVVRTTCEGISVGLNILGTFGSLIFFIPIIGRLLQQLKNILVEIFWRLIGGIGFILCFAGVKIKKQLRICVIITGQEELNDEKERKPVESEETIKAALKTVQKIYKEEANIRVKVNGIYTDTRRIIETECKAKYYWEDLWTTGFNYQVETFKHSWDGTWDRFIGLGSTICIFIVNKLEHSDGCSLGPLTDYITIGPKKENITLENYGNVIAHELGHSLGLWDVSSKKYPNNLMIGEGGIYKENLRKNQVCIIRNSRFVTLLPGSLPSLMSLTFLL